MTYEIMDDLSGLHGYSLEYLYSLRPDEVEALRALKPEEDCGTCDGSGEVVLGFRPSTYFDPPEQVDGPCPTCGGAGVVPLGTECPTEEDALAEAHADYEARRYEARAGRWS